MYTRSFVLFPVGIAEGEITLPDGGVMLAQDFCLRCSILCCEMPPTFISNPTHQLNEAFSLLEERKREICSPQTQIVVVLTMSQPINAVLNARRRLASNIQALEDAMWVVYVGNFIDSFRQTALRCGTIEGEMDAFPTWKTHDYGSFSVLTPRLADPVYLELSARRYWRNAAPRVQITQKSGSFSRMNAIRPPSGKSSSSFPAVAPPPDISNKKP